MALFQERKTGMKTVRIVMVALGIALNAGCLHATAETRHSGTTEINMKMTQLRGALEIYWGKHDLKYPASLDELAQFAYTNMVARGIPLLKEGDLIDTWGEPIVYETDGYHRFIIRSSGPDKKMGTADDVIRACPTLYEIEVIQKAREALTAVNQGTNVVQTATAKTVPPPAGTAKVTPNRVPTPTAQPPAESDKTAKPQTTPWKIPLLIGIVAIIGVMAAWRCFRKGRKGK
jgi:hypothetical protein